MTTSSTARVICDRPGRYGKQLASHFAKKLETRWDSETGRGHLSFTGEAPGAVEMIAGDGVLLLQLETSSQYLDHLEAVIGRHLVRFGARDGLAVHWKRPGSAAGTTQVAEPGEDI
ncbi:MAG TPA: DUF2218 domain-containing protein [Corynebacterium sp.]|nr:DUF2218 domain-containing protein [Corynebacterium sp.]